ncbi:MAG: hypothetical protein ACRD2E_06585 [Terriglobales bacterium]
MKPRTGAAASLAAALGAIATLACCLPFGFAAAVGVGAAGVFFNRLRPFLLALSGALLLLAIWQYRRHARQCAPRRRRASRAILWFGAAVVLAMVLFPQQVSALIADLFIRTPR